MVKKGVENILLYFRNRKIKKGLKKDSLEIMKKYAEGQINTKDFWEIFKNNSCIKEILNKDKTRQSHSITSYYAPERIIGIYDENKLEDRAELYNMIKEYFIRNKMKYIFYNEDANTWDFLQEIQPRWIDVRDEEFLLSIVNLAPNGLTEEQKKQWCELKIKEIFKYDKNPPEWLQNPEWPIINGKPLIFKELIEEIKDDFIIVDHYIFYDELTKEEVTITQWDYR